MDNNQVFIIWSSTVSAALGAAFGSVTAYLLTRWNEDTRRLTDEITACNAAIGQCASIVNTFVAVKRQQVKPMHENYLAQCQTVIETVATPGDEPPNLELNYDLNRLTPPWTCIEALNKLIASRIISSFEPSGLAPSLTQAIHNQRKSTDSRNELVEKFRSYDEDEKMARYFGVPASAGEGVDRSYPDTMHGITVYTDDCLYFASLLGDVLAAHAFRLAIQLGRKAPQVKQLNFDQMKNEGLMPNPDGYAAFEKQYRPKKIDMFVTM